MTTRTIDYRLYIAWDGTNYTDESSRLISANGEMSLAPPEDAITSSGGIVDTMTLTLQNIDGRFSPFYSSSPLAALISSGKAYHAPCYLEVNVNAGAFTRVFTGVVKTPQESGSSASEIASVHIECRSRDEMIMQKRISTTGTEFRTYHQDGYNESDLIAAWLNSCGVTASQYTLDPGLFTIDYAWLDDESPLEEIWNLAAACGGRFYANADGLYVYENATHWLTAARSVTSQETLDDSSFVRCEPAYDDRELYNVVTVEASPRFVVSSDTLWEPDEEVYIPAGGSKVMTAVLRQPGYVMNAPTFTAVSAGGVNISGNVAVFVVSYAQRAILTITNNHATLAAYLKPLRITGNALVGGPTQEESRNSAQNGSNSAFFTSRGDRTRSLRGNTWIQNKAHAGMLAEFLLMRHERPRLTYRLTGCPGKPSRRLGDRVTIQDPSIMSSSRTALLTAISWSLDKSGFRQELTAIDLAQLYPYLDASPGYFVTGVNKLGASEALRGRLFF